MALVQNERCFVVKPSIFCDIRAKIGGFRWAILGKNFQIYWQGFSLSMLLVFGLLISGIWYFRKMERTFADII